MENEKRRIDFLASDVRFWWEEAYVYAKEKKIKTQKALLIIAFFSGIVATIIWLINY
ncbi:MAG: hypothetical protein UR78_C0007G0033 [Candidatus Moranbacteria bacterium GW2011_GWF2_35_39]|nr:MAG: hypothetical protein UR78_C0007G0033 [Candidatus Moranbacteria bacterium GW2011_GWF2_35_39]